MERKPRHFHHRRNEKLNLLYTPWIKLRIEISFLSLSHLGMASSGHRLFSGAKLEFALNLCGVSNNYKRLNSFALKKGQGVSRLV